MENDIKNWVRYFVYKHTHRLIISKAIAAQQMITANPINRVEIFRVDKNVGIQK